MWNKIIAMDKNKIIIFIFIVLVVAGSVLAWKRPGIFDVFRQKLISLTDRDFGNSSLVSLDFAKSFQNNETVEEAGKMSSSKNSFWWLNSGGLAVFENGTLKTNIGNLPDDNFWRTLYAKTNSRDTENGYQPQNIFRLVTRNKWQDLDQKLYFKIDKLNLSASDFRNESNGVLLFNRYYDGDNLYYAGLRVDGDAVIKKKVDGKYYTLDETQVFTNGQKYDRDKNPNVLPVGDWIGIRSEVKNLDDSTVEVKLYVDKDNSGNWNLVMDAKDKKGKNGKKLLTDPGYGGIRTDFMDVELRDYSISKL